MRKIHRATTLAMVLLLVGAVSRTLLSSQVADVPCDSISMEYEFLGGGGGPPVASRAEPAGHKVILNKSGQSELHRNGHYALYGVTVRGTDFTGVASLRDFGEFCKLAKEPAFEALASSYGSGGSDGTRLTFKIVSGTTTKLIGERNSRGPVELRAFEQAVQAAAQKIQWSPK